MDAAAVKLPEKAGKRPEALASTTQLKRITVNVINSISQLDLPTFWLARRAVCLRDTHKYLVGKSRF